MHITLRKKQALYIVLFAFAISILVRLPNLSRPVSKHHEFITALILINLESWRQAGGGQHFHYTPVMSYQNPGDKHPEKAVYVDHDGNQLYLSLGPAWYMIPYFVYQVFHLPVTPIYLRILNLFFNLAAVILFFYLLQQLISPGTKNRYWIIVTGCLLFMFTPGMLWYFGNGYVHTAIMLPFVIGLMMVLMPMLQSSHNINFPRLLLLAILVILLIYIDWFAVFISFCAAAWALGQSAKEKRYILLALVLMTATLAGIALIFWQFASYAGVQTITQYWKLRFLSRSFTNGHIPLWEMIISLFKHLLTAWSPLLFLIVASAISLRIKKDRIIFSEKEKLFIYIYGASAVLYNMVLLNWSFEHEFSIIPAGVLLVYLGIRLFITAFKGRAAYLLFGIFFILAIVQYYYINRPGAISRDGMAFNTFEVFGEQLKQIPKDHKIFMYLGQVTYPMIEYYAGRNITGAQNMASAKKKMQQWGITKAVWIEHDNFQFRKIVVIH